MLSVFLCLFLFAEGVLEFFGIGCFFLLVWKSNDFKAVLRCSNVNFFVFCYNYYDLYVLLLLSFFDLEKKKCFQRKHVIQSWYNEKGSHLQADKKPTMQNHFGSLVTSYRKAKSHSGLNHY